VNVMMDDMLAAITGFVRRNPRTSAIAAFNIGLYAATVARKNFPRSDIKELPGKLVSLVPSMQDLLGLLGEHNASPRRNNNRRRGHRKTAARGQRARARGTAAGHPR
jgi:hypothetical protein